MQDIINFYCSTYVYTRAHTHILRLELAGFQSGSLVSGNMRGKLFRKLSTGDSAGFKAAIVVPQLRLLQSLHVTCLLTHHCRRSLSLLFTFCLAVIGRPIKTDKALVTSFKGYDACSLPLVSLVEAIVRTTGAAPFTAAVNEYFATCGVDVVGVGVGDCSSSR